MTSSENPVHQHHRTSRLRLPTLRRLSTAPWAHCLALVLLGFVVRSPALQGQLVWDDEYLARDNPFIKSPLLVLEVFRHHLFLDSFSGHYRPMQNVSLMLDYWVWGTNPWGYHLTNVLLHLAAGVLLYFLLLRLLSSFAALKSASEEGRLRVLPLVTSFVVALLWMVHPVHSAAVDYISGRADSLAFLFASAAWLLVLRARERQKARIQVLLYVAASAAGLLALCSRESACLWLILFLLHTLLCREQLPLRVKAATIAVTFVVALAYAGLRTLPEDQRSSGPTHGWSAPARGVLMLRALGDYSRLMLFPHKLHMERTIVDPRNYSGRDQWRVSAGSDYLSLLGGAALVALAIGCSWRGRGQVVRIGGAGWFMIAYLPVSNVVDLNATVAEHWLYLASVGFILFLAGVVIDLPVRWQRLATMAACLAGVALGARSYSRSGDWVDPETFYRKTIEAGGVSARVGSNYGNILANKGDYAGAEKIFRRVLAFAPDYPIARNNLADVCLRLGKKAEAEAIFAQAAGTAAGARSEYPRTWIAALNLAKVQHKDDPVAALHTLARARKEYPRTWDIFSFEAEVLRRLGRVQEATALVGEYASANWWHYGATLALGRLYTEAGDVSQAENALRHASRLDVHEVEALNLIVQIKLRHDQFAEAHAFQRRAVARQPNHPRQYLLLAEVLEKMGRAQEAKSALAHLRELELIAGAAVVAN